MENLYLLLLYLYRLYAAASQLYGELLQRDPNDTKSRIQRAKAFLNIVSAYNIIIVVLLTYYRTLCACVNKNNSLTECLQVSCYCIHKSSKFF